MRLMIAKESQFRFSTNSEGIGIHHFNTQNWLLYPIEKLEPRSFCVAGFLMHTSVPNKMDEHRQFEHHFCS